MFVPDYDRSLETPGALPGVTTEAVTDTGGRFRFAGLGCDQLAHRAFRAPGVVDTAIEVMTRNAPDVHFRLQGMSEDVVTYGASFTAALKSGRTVRGVVRDKTTGTPLADVWIGPRFERSRG